MLARQNCTEAQLGHQGRKTERRRGKRRSGEEKGEVEKERQTETEREGAKETRKGYMTEREKERQRGKDILSSLSTCVNQKLGIKNAIYFSHLCSRDTAT